MKTRACFSREFGGLVLLTEVGGVWGTVIAIGARAQYDIVLMRRAALAAV